MKNRRNEEGFALIFGLVVMVILSIIGIAALTNTSLELQIAGNERLHKETFYKAESGDMLTSNIIEENIYCADGFNKTGTSTYNVYTYSAAGVGDPDNTWSNNVDVSEFGTVRTHGWLTESSITAPVHTYNDLAFYLNDRPWEGTICNIFMPDRPSVSYPIANITANIDNDINRTDVYLGGNVKKLPGGSLQMAAGYERLGKSAAGGGAVRAYDIISRHRGVQESESVVIFGWDHLIGMEFGNDDYCR